MASPLRWFRRHQQIMMVFFGVGLMAIFGLGSVFTMINPSDLSRGSDNPVIARWKGGTFTRNDLRGMQTRHYSMQRFLAGLQQYAAAKKGDNFQPFSRPISPLDQGEEFRQQTVDGVSIQRFLLAEYAKKEGLVVSDGMVDDYLALTAGNIPISRDETMAINKKANDTSSLDAIYSRLKLELAAQQMEQFVSAIPIIRENTFLPASVSPTEAMELYARTAQLVECRVLPISVDPASVTAEPSVGELKKLYEEGKANIAGGSGLEPGFRIERKVKVQYLYADFETFLQNEINTLTDKEVQDEYDRLVEAGDPMVMELVPDESIDDVLRDIVPPLEGDPKSDPASDGNPDATKGDEVAPKTEAEKSDEAAEKKADDKSGSDTPDQSIVVGQRETFVSTEQDETKKEEAKKEETVDKSEQKSDPGQTDDKTKETADEAAQKTADPESGKTEMKAQDPTGGDTAVQDPAVKPQDEIVLPEIKDEQEPERRPRPLKDVADLIKRSLKNKDAFDKMTTALKSSNRDLGDYRYLYQRKKFAPEGEEVEEAGELDLAKIASDYKLEWKETELVTFLELTEETIGKQSVMKAIPFRGQMINMPYPVPNVIFQEFDELVMYSLSEASAADGSVYQYWVSEKQESYVPEFDEVEAEVRKFWQTQQALEKALAEAKKISEDMNKSGKTLEAEYPEKSVPTGQFSWFNTLTGLKISNPPGITNANDELMETIFSLKPMETAYGANDNRDTVYVIQLIETGKNVDEIAEEYLTNEFFRFKKVPEDVSAASDFYSREHAQAWGIEFREQMGLEYEEQ